MDTAIVRQFVDFFKDFLYICQLENWPVNDTSEEEIKNVFLMSSHIEKCIDMFQRKDLLNELFCILNNCQEISHPLLKSCLTDPKKYVLKKIINSCTKIGQMDIGFSIFIDLFTEKKLEICLSAIILESASIETLLKHIPTQIQKNQLLDFKSKLFLLEINSTVNCKETIINIVNSDQETMDVLVNSLLFKDEKYLTAINKIINLFMDIMKNKNSSNQVFWRRLFSVDEKLLIQMCYEHSDLFKLLATALIDIAKLLQEHMSSELFYINISYSELMLTVRKICNNNKLRIEFFDIVSQNECKTLFWENML